MAGEPSSAPRDTLGGRGGPSDIAIDGVSTRTFEIPTDAPEADGTLSWDSTTVVLVQARAGDETGLGYSYAPAAAAHVVSELLAESVCGMSALAPNAAWEAMRRAVRNAGRPGIATDAISAVDVALWDLKARLLGVPLSLLLGRVRDAVPVYGSGGFTSYDDGRLQAQLAGWVQDGIGAVKMKVGSDPARDPGRVRSAREAIGPGTGLFVDANGAYTRKQALSLANQFAADADVTWFEEPVSSDDLEGLALLRDRAPAAMDIAAGEYGWDLYYFRRMLDAGSVDVLQADVTRCGGITGMLGVGALCAAHGLPLSAHTSPAIHAHVCAAMEPVVHVEYFHDHVRIEQLLFDGTPELVKGALAPQTDRPGLGLELREQDAERFER